jgi:hypothetical protein
MFCISIGYKSLMSFKQLLNNCLQERQDPANIHAICNQTPAKRNSGTDFNTEEIGQNSTQVKIHIEYLQGIADKIGYQMNPELHPDLYQEKNCHFLKSLGYPYS